jgi:hypothetical protein
MCVLASFHEDNPPYLPGLLVGSRYNTISEYADIIANFDLMLDASRSWFMKGRLWWERAICMMFVITNTRQTGVPCKGTNSVYKKAIHGAVT